MIGLSEQIVDINSRLEKQEKYTDSIRATVDTLMHRNTKIEQESLKKSKNISDLEKSLATARQEINNLEQYGRRMMCVVKGIPRFKKESTDDIIMNISRHLNVNIKKSDIDISHRTSSKDDADIIVKFDSRKSRNLFYEGRKKMKDIPTTTTDLGYTVNNKIYINESLTAINGDLFKFAREQLKKNESLQVCVDKQRYNQSKEGRQQRNKGHNDKQQRAGQQD